MSVPTNISTPLTAGERAKKFPEAMLYVAHLCAEHEAFGRVKLAKALFYSDFCFYERTRRSITGQQYQRRTQGPMPVDFYPVLKRLARAGDLTEMDRDFHGTVEKRPVPHRSPDLGLFSEDELATIRESVEWLRPLTASQASDLSHGFVGWQVFQADELIPYDSVFFMTRQPTPGEADVLRRQLIEQGLAE